MSLSNTQYDSIIKKYEDTQSRNRHLASKRLTEVYDAIPEYRELDQSVGSLSVAQARLALDGDPDAIHRLRASLADLSARKRKLLAGAGYPADYLDPIYTCALCQDTGYITSPQGTKTKCRCFQQQEIALLYGSATGKTVGGILKIVGGSLLGCTSVSMLILSAILWRGAGTF